MKLLILSQALENYKPLTDLTWANQREYAARQGYDFHGHMGRVAPESIPYDFDRILLIYRALFDRSFIATEYDYVWWLGSDAMVMNHTRRIEDILKPAGKSLYLSWDINGINSDSAIFRRSDWSKRFLETTVSMEVQYRAHPHYTQRLWQDLFSRKESSGIAWHEGVGFLHHTNGGAANSLFYDMYNWPDSTPGHFQPGDLVLHLPGANLQERLDMFKSERVKNLMVK